ncbi:MAG TPA: EcsC family protein [Candidatus Limnocylindrales bacterium]|nr:EcsC family protein [Candidatus Limnocylindrales bacterium]
MTLASGDLDDLRYAKNLLEHPSLAARLAGALGRPIEMGIGALPAGASAVISTAARKSLDAALSFAVSSMDDRRRDSIDWGHKLAVALTGAAGGMFGLPALAVELPLSTTIMLRSIADIARSEGEPIKTSESKLSCIEVFALGGKLAGDDASESAYFAVRLALTKALTDAAEHLAGRGITGAAAPSVVRFLSQVATRFGVPVSEKILAQSIPVVGAAGGALFNTLFIDHFQDMARGHFIVRRLERAYGPEEVRLAYMRVH